MKTSMSVISPPRRSASGHGFSRAAATYSHLRLQPLSTFTQRLKPPSLLNVVGPTKSRAVIQSKSALEGRGRMLWTKSFRFGTVALACSAALIFATQAHAADLKLPSTLTAGQPLSFSAAGSGETTMYISGPGTAIKRKVQIGQVIKIDRDELKNAGRYIVAIEGGSSGAFFVTAAPVRSIAFLARPS